MTKCDVRVMATTESPVEAVWQALIDPLKLSGWFGDLDRPWQVGMPTRVDFGDGDFFTATAVEIVDRRHVEFEWSFLGVGALSRVCWAPTVLPSGTEIEITDVEPSRTPAESAQMVEGWTDFADRLVRYLATGRPTRYGWREQIDGSVDLPSGADPLADMYRWLPIASDGFGPHWFFVVDEEGPRQFEIVSWSSLPTGLRFGVKVPDARMDTSCEVNVDRVPGGTRLSFIHTGWRALGLPSERVRRLRSRFAATWTAALREAAARG